MRNIIRSVYRLLLNITFSKKKNTLRVIKSNNLKQLIWEEEIVGRRIATRTYEKMESNFFKKHIKSDDVCLDIGSNIGYFSQLMASLTKTGKVISIEANPKNAALIRLNSFLNGFENKIILFNNAASNVEGETINFNGTSDSAYGFVQKEEERELYSYIEDNHSFKKQNLISISTRTIDSILHEIKINKVDILKMDIEGFEYYAILGMEKLLKSDSGPRLMLMELVDEHLQYYNSNLNDTLEFLKDCGYTIKNIINGELIDYNPELKESNLVFIKS